MSHSSNFSKNKQTTSLSSFTTITILQISSLALFILIILAWVLKIMRERQQFIDDKRNNFQDIAMTPIRDALVLEMSALDEISPETIDNIISKKSSQDDVRNHMKEMEAISQERLNEMEQHAEAFINSSSNQLKSSSALHLSTQSLIKIQTPNTDDGSTLSASTSSSIIMSSKIEQAPLPNIVGERDN